MPPLCSSKSLLNIHFFCEALELGTEYLLCLLQIYKDLLEGLPLPTLLFNPRVGKKSLSCQNTDDQAAHVTETHTTWPGDGKLAHTCVVPQTIETKSRQANVSFSAALFTFGTSVKQSLSIK